MSNPTQVLIDQLGCNYQVKKTNKFVVHGTEYFGVVKSLSSCFYGANFKPMGARRRGKTLSSKETGIRVHQHIFHRYSCPGKTDKKKCVCKAKFGVAPRRPTTGSQLYNMLEAFKKFLAFHDWKVLACEVVAAVPESRRATAIDVVCTNNTKNPTGIFVLELKTGYVNGRKTARTLDKSGMMRGEYGKEIPNTMANHHQLQLWFGVEALEQTYGVKVDRAIVVYLRTTGTFVAESGKKWWWKNKELRARLYRQFIVSTC